MNEIKGYSKLSKPAKKLFNEVYLRQQAALGRNEKLNYAPVKVIERKSYIEVHFSNGEFSKYFQDGTWG